MDKYSKIIVDVVTNNNVSKIDLLNVDFEKLLVKASHNRVLHVYCKRLLVNAKSNISNSQRKILEKISLTSERYLLAAHKTIKQIDKIFKKHKIEYLIVKTFKYIDYVTFDIDVLVKYSKFEQALKVLNDSDFKIEDHPGKKTQGLHQRNCLKSGLLKIDLHRKFFWLGIEHISEDFLWKNTRTMKLYNFKCPVPSNESDFILHNKQLLYERRYVTLLDFIAIKKSIENGINFSAVSKEIEKFCWDESYLRLMLIINWLNFKMFGKYLLKNHDIKKISNKCLSMPYHFDLKHVMQIFFEMWQRHNLLSIFGFSYYVFTTVRYKLKNRLPFYDHWFNFSKISKQKYTVAKCIHE